MSIKTKVTAAVIILLLMVVHATVSHAAEPGGTPVKVAILPFNMHTPSQLMYLQDGIRDMLTSRLGWEGKVQVIDRTAVDQATRGVKSDISAEDAQRMGRTLKADYVVFGSLTGIGQAISIDGKMSPLTGKGEPLSFSAQTRTLDDVVPQINLFAQEINQKAFARPGEKTQSAARTEEEAYSTRNPELLVPTAMLPGEKISYLNPNFIEVTPEGSLRQGGIWRSQDFQGGIVGMDVGDLDGDGKVEVAMATQNKVMVYRKEGAGLRSLATYNGLNNDHYLWLCVMDANRDGRAEIYVTNLRTLTGSRPLPSEVQQKEPGYGRETLVSFVLTLAGSKLAVECENVPYFLNAVEMPKRGKILLGQKKGETNQGAFDSDIFEMQLKPKGLTPLVKAHLPSRCNVFNFAKADLKHDGSEQTILIDNSNYLIILNAAGDQIWRSDRLFGCTTNAFTAKVEDLRFNQMDYYSIPSPIQITDLNQDGIPEIVVTRTLSEALTKILPQGLKFYDRGEIVSLSWDQIGLVENWKTREVSGMISAIRIADLNNDGSQQLVASLLLAKDYTKLWQSKSTLISYSLNIATAAAQAKK